MSLYDCTKYVRINNYVNYVCHLKLHIQGESDNLWHESSRMYAGNLSMTFVLLNENEGYGVSLSFLEGNSCKKQK